MNYVSQPFALKVKRLLRYVHMYGLRRTYVKVQGQQHMRRRFGTLPPCTRKFKSGQVVGVLGCGNYCFTNIAYFLTKCVGQVIGGCMDTSIERAASLSRHYGIPFYTKEAHELLDQDALQLIYIASNHASHAEYAIEALRRGKDVYIEKPHVVSWEQLRRLLAAMDHSGGRVYLGFNRPSSRIGRKICDALHGEDGPGVYNWFVAGHYLPADHWYNRPEEGGRVFGNLCHWTDFLYSLVGPEGLPAEIVPVRGSSNDVDVIVSYKFRDASLGVISFSAKSEPFEGIMERFTAQRGECLVNMDNFLRLTIQVGAARKRYRGLFRDHGHKDNIVVAYKNSIKSLPYDRVESRARIANTAVLYLKTKEALDKNRPLVAYPFDEACIMTTEASHEKI